MSYQGVPFPVDIANASAWFQMGRCTRHEETTSRSSRSTMPAIITSLAKTSQMAKAAGFNLKRTRRRPQLRGRGQLRPVRGEDQAVRRQGHVDLASPVPNEFNFFRPSTRPVSTRSSSVRPPGTPTSAQAFNKDSGLLDNLNAGMAFQMLENDNDPAREAVHGSRHRGRRQDRAARYAGDVVVPAVGHRGQGVRLRPDPASA